MRRPIIDKKANRRFYANRIFNFKAFLEVSRKFFTMMPHNSAKIRRFWESIIRLGHQWTPKNRPTLISSGIFKIFSALRGR
jgi:hypothetical protein